MDWHENLDDRTRDREKAERLARALSKLPGSQDRKIRFLELHMMRMEANAALRLQQQGIDADEDHRAMGRAMVSIAFAYWKSHVQQQRREMPQEQGPRTGKLEKLSLEVIDGGKKAMGVEEPF